jgi:type 1 glutamine amidotransferase
MTMTWRLLKIALALLALGALWFGWQAWGVLDRHDVFKEPVFERDAPLLPDDLGDNAVLVFSKTNGYRHLEAIPRVEELFREFAQAEGLRLVVTENAAIHNPAQLAHFRLVVWNNNTNDVLLPEQQAALRAWLEGGGRWLGIHGAGGSREFGWDWYPDELLRARFTGHPLMPQFQQGALQIEDRDHPATAHLPARWSRVEEWYSFAASPRGRGVNVLASLDEQSYQPPDALRMGGDHPLIWWHRVGRGYVFYSALGHQGSAYDEPDHRTLLLNAARWLLAAGGSAPAADDEEPPAAAP